ncbi:ABC transporter substrate-binding protein [Candidatus Poriferisodalis sp.]|uniref:ABC transporter substrate-binding protein n=1 Tax=Candidatus Poriferisodalis sp. TaxID=3101277 RepID=UPI003B012FEF
MTVLALVATACGDDSDDETADEASTQEPAATAPSAEEPSDDASAPATEPDSSDDETTAEDSSPQVSGTVEVFSWWTSGGEAAALDALFATLTAIQPNIEIVNAAIAGGGGSSARAVLQTRLGGGDPPDTWQTHHGAEILGQYAAAGFTTGLDALYREQGWYELIPAGLIEALSHNGDPQMVLAGVHRGNGFWYNKTLLDGQGVSVGDTLSVDQFLSIAADLDAAGIDALCVGDNGIWASAELFENTLVGVIGPQAYLGLWDGSTSFESPEVKNAISIYSQFLDYQNDDHVALSWDQAVSKVIDGSCAFNSMGDWAFGEFLNANLEEGVDFGWVSHPGSHGAFVAVTDGFTLAVGAPNPDATIEWLKAIGSLEGQTAFNQLKGSICARTDCDRGDFGRYHNWAMDSFGSAVIVPTVVHGSAAPAAFQQALNDAITVFVVSRDVDALASELAAAARASGFGG